MSGFLGSNLSSGEKSFVDAINGGSGGAVTASALQCPSPAGTGTVLKDGDGTSYGKISLTGGYCTFGSASNSCQMSSSGSCVISAAGVLILTAGTGAYLSADTVHHQDASTNPTCDDVYAHTGACSRTWVSTVTSVTETMPTGVPRTISGDLHVTGKATIDGAVVGGFFSFDVTLTGGTKTIASGKDLTNATLLSVRLKTPTTATGDPVATFVAGANGNVTVTSYTAGAVQAITDASTYTCVFAGAV